MVIRHSTGWDQITAIVGSDEAVAHQLSVKCQVDLSSAQKLPPFYIGALGSSKAHSKRLKALQASGYGEEVDRVHAPIGLVKAKDAQTLGLFILGEIAASRI